VETGYGIEAKLPASRVTGILNAYAVANFRSQDWSGGLLNLTEGFEDYFGSSPAAQVYFQRIPRAPLVPLPYRQPPPSPNKGILLRFLLFVGASFAFLVSPWNSPLVLAGFWMLWTLSLPTRHLFFHRRRAWIGGGLLLYALLASRLFPGTNPHLSLALGCLGVGLAVGLYTFTRRCPRCKRGYTDAIQRTLRPATSSSNGLGETTLTCPRCQFHHVASHVIPRRVDASTCSESAWPTEPPASSFGGSASGGQGAGRDF
jgi:uncharacterized membrane protein YgcG